MTLKAYIQHVKDVKYHGHDLSQDPDLSEGHEVRQAWSTTMQN